MMWRPRPDENWEAMLKRWSQTQSDGTYRPATCNLSEEEVQRKATNKAIVRVYKIASSFDLDKDVFEREYPVPSKFEALLVELLGLAESVDVSYLLNTVDSLASLIYIVLPNQHASIRAKAAEVVTTLIQKNPETQQFLMRIKALRPLLSIFSSDPDVTARTKALGAISSLIRNNTPGIIEFQLQKGYESLKDALSSESVSFQREALNLIQYLLHEDSSNCNIVTELGFPRIMMHLTSSDDAEVREAALSCLLVLARDKDGGNSGQLVKNNDKLKQVLQDLGAAREERQLVDSLVLLGEDAPVPDVASKLFEPPLRAAEAADRNSVSEKNSEKKEAPLLLGLGSPSAATPTTPTFQSDSSSKRRKLH